MLSTRLTLSPPNACCFVDCLFKYQDLKTTSKIKRPRYDYFCRMILHPIYATCVKRLCIVFTVLINQKQRHLRLFIVFLQQRSFQLLLPLVKLLILEFFSIEILGIQFWMEQRVENQTFEVFLFSLGVKSLHSDCIHGFDINNAILINLFLYFCLATMSQNSTIITSCRRAYSRDNKEHTKQLVNLGINRRQGERLRRHVEINKLLCSLP